MAAARIAGDAGLTNVITYDMGGTSTDVALVSGGVPEISSNLQIEYGLPVHFGPSQFTSARWITGPKAAVDRFANENKGHISPVSSIILL